MLHLTSLGDYRRQQYHQEVVHVPTFSRLYEVNSSHRLTQDAVLSFLQIFISLEKEIEDSLPQFQELLLTLRYVRFNDVSS
jgi:rabenosyn-5